ncbi:putative branched-chain amino acid permease (azaleucine resistance) [Schinkia azotoformans MEV2011]|uniref:Putative branched-chain amino acid permease (Azaleucine resistance) n=1 Tax=Schinkia azotoformans MEV2011 TaxID=1348973 RepID=A0A072NP55_SCHAZ|nr:AzlC family ABC transporter permease [Schinkia azotoformans]KEF38668.1 putative branched-chain amino acid permease (azaleucine resistance) [Schinkia azotoformans MEV2011]MEC1696902.1 AzlC family ABC transporter permease [Schinkia azotoformans]MEC1727241.1 AzlC family ABC transporter permease [Schinkia azotoformans]MEC1747777.1 AzlC family ABC transporter permease [Schinkia azotoformans]MEC1773925.1 AzlC family ABC transporter permease [Schinkia azotoformans]
MNELANKVYKEETLLTFSQGVKDCVPTLIGYISIGIAMGIVGAASNLSIVEVALMSVLVYAGASQFIICALLVSGSPFSVIVFTTFIVNLRHFLLSMTLAPHFTKYSLMKNIGIGSLLTDESFGVAVNKIVKREMINASWMNGLNVTAYIFWILSCTLGALFGKWISNPEVLGLDFSLTAMFLALLVLQLESMDRGKLKLYLSLIVYVVLLMLVLCMFVPSYIAILLSTIIVATIGVVKDK